jgi:hypothetical protein
MRSDRGSLWKKWDLHVHTPESLVHNYPGQKEEAWSAFLDDVEALPPEMKVLGINDYLFIDGYRRVLQEREAGRLHNIELVLPVVELRLNTFAGANEHLKRVNFHVVFSDELSPDLIQAQFLNALAPKYQLSPAYAEAARAWQAVPTYEGLTELGRLIIESVPVERRREFKAPLIEGFNNFNIELRDVLEILERPHFEGKYLRGVGKTEWDAIAWSDNTIADKKLVINSADFVFVAAESPERWARARRALEAAAVNSHLLDCSDAHQLSSSTQKDRLGNCWTWIKADTSFDGLKHALTEFDQRVFVGNQPELLAKRREHGSRYIDRISLMKVEESSLAETWFRADIPINAGLVAIIGNKGTGKSALAETVGVVGNTRQQQFFSFLSAQKFRQRQSSKAAHFKGALTWANGAVHTKRLDAPHDSAGPELVQFIPQNFLEKVCNEIPGGEERDFDRELKRVIFSHVESPDRLGQPGLDELLAFKTRASEARLDELRRDLATVNQEIIGLEVQLTPEHRRGLRTQAHTVVEALRDLRRSAPDPVPEPTPTPESAAIAAQVAEAQRAHEAALEMAEVRDHELTAANTQATLLEQFIGRVDAFERSYVRLRSESADLLAALDWSLQDVVSLQTDRERLSSAVAALDARRATLRAEVEASRAAANEQLQARNRLQTQLDAPNQAFQAYLAKQDEWEREWEALLGTPEIPGTLRYVRARRREWSQLPSRLVEAQLRRRELVGRIHDQLTALVSEYAQVYRPIQTFVANQPVNREVGLSVTVGLVDSGFEVGFFDYINRRVASTFAGTQEGEAVVRDLLATFDLNTCEGALNFVEAVEQGLRRDERNGGRAVTPAGLLRKGKELQDLYDFVFGLGYLEPRYTLQFGEKDLHQLSPGEKGTLLLIFYLLVDKSQTPLVIDQPEDNLDNQTVYQVLVTCVREARRRRQIFIVTHNPNLAVVCDADQVIVSTMDKDRGNQIDYEAGALENPAINGRVIDILEGTRPAFENRGLKYQRIA